MNEHSIHDNFDYDDTELLSKMFSKDQNRSGMISHNDLQLTLQNKNDNSRYLLKQNLVNQFNHNNISI